jgi:AraC family ethanolamine operon transcriptional activator
MRVSRDPFDYAKSEQSPEGGSLDLILSASSVSYGRQHHALMRQSSETNPAPAKPCELVMSGVIRREAFEDLAGCMKDYFQIDAVQLESGDFQGQVDFIAAEGLLLYRENYPLRTHLEGELVGNRFGFSIPLLTADARFLGETVDDSRISSSISGESFDHMMEGGYEQMILLMDYAKLLQMAEQLSLPEASLKALLPGRRKKTLQSKHHDIQSIREIFIPMLNAARQGNLNISADQFEKVIFDAILPVLDGGEHDLDRGPAAVTVHRALELARSITGPVCVTDLCMVLNVNPRTLHKAFIKIMGIPPYQFFQKRRLCKAYQMLLNTDPREFGVTDIARQLGFSELGRFSGQYRAMFGESPSETIRRFRNCTVVVPWR